MFDTSLVRPRAIAAPRFALFGVSLAVHSAAVVAAVALSLASTQLPTRPPGQMEIYRPFTLPETPPAYGHPARPKNPQPAPKTPVVQQLPAGTAPNLIPDQTPAVGPDSGPATTETGTGEGPVGVPWGDPDSVNAETQPVAAAPAQPVAPLTPGGDVRPAQVLQRVQPRYPQIMVNTGMTAVVTVHCVIGKDGTIRDPQIVQSSFPPFNEAVLDAVRQWTFAPGTRRGEPVDTYFELTVRFVVSR